NLRTICPNIDCSHEIDVEFVLCPFCGTRLVEEFGLYEKLLDTPLIDLPFNKRAKTALLSDKNDHLNTLGDLKEILDAGEKIYGIGPKTTPHVEIIVAEFLQT
ncbi:MAG: hypothetical protein ACXAD7_09680, partial [Candidatus Kariarchaeaceae archaeon]